MKRRPDDLFLDDDPADAEVKLLAEYLYPDITDTAAERLTCVLIRLINVLTDRRVPCPDHDVWRLEPVGEVYPKIANFALAYMFRHAQYDPEMAELAREWRAAFFDA
jgi:hypothetical protein